jgi:TolB-like protein
MVPGECPAEVVRKQLERVLASPGFARNERLSRFLRVVVELHLEGRDGDLKESVLGVDVFGRKPGFDPKQDSTVRSEAGRLRARLAEYYAGEGIGDPVIIELPKGGYTPAFRPISVGEERSTRAMRFWVRGALAGCALAAVAAGWWWFQHKSTPVAIAVLPLTNLSLDPANDYFADGLTDEIIRNLSIIDGLAVRSQTSSFVFKGKPRNVREAGQQLQAEYILEGSVLRTGQQLRINTQLVRARDDFPLWSGRFDRELTDIVAIQDEISRGIVNSLRLKLGRGRRRYETSTEAYDLYLRARHLESQSGLAGFQGLGPDEEALYKEAVAKDPSFAPAYAGLAAVYAFVSGGANADRADELGQMQQAAEKAIQLDPLLAEAHDALGTAYAHHGRWLESEKSFRRAIELDPNRSTSYVDFAMYLLLPLGRVEEAVHQLQIADKSDPLSPQVQSIFGYVLISAGRYNEADGHCQRAADRNECMGRVFYGKGRLDEAIQLLSTVSNPRFFGYALGKAGHRKEAEKLAATVARNPFQQALIFAGLADKDRTFEALNRMTAQGAVRIGRTLTFPELSLVRGDPRVAALRKKVGLP